MTKPVVTVDTTFEVGFKLPNPWVAVCPTEQPTALARTHSLNEEWRIIFHTDDAELLAETFELLAAKIRALKV
jgi:hypothetical protein